MSLEEACNEARRRRDLYDMDVHVLCDSFDEYYTILEMNLPMFLNSRINIDKKVYFTAWKLKK